MLPDPHEESVPRIVGRYALHGAIASGGMATVHLGRLVGPGGFGRTVAIKRLHPQFARDPEFVAMFLDEARLAARVQHPNVVATLDIIALKGELFLVMEHVRGESLSRLVRYAQRLGELVPLPVASAILAGALSGLHAAHETRDERGRLLGIVHRDISPQNLLVGVDGVARVLDFGVAKALGRVHTTQDGKIKGKLAYMAPEQLRRSDLDRTADLYALAVVLWETITSERLFKGDSEAHVVAKVLEGTVPRPSSIAAGVPPELDAVVLRGLERDPAKRFATASEMAAALERAVRPATQSEVAAWVSRLASEPIRKQSELIAELESGSDVTSGVETQAKMFLAELASRPSLPTEEAEMPSAKSGLSSVGMTKGADVAPLPSSRSRVATWLAVGAVAAVGVAFAATRGSAWLTPSGTGVTTPSAHATAAPEPPSSPSSGLPPAPPATSPVEIATAAATSTAMAASTSIATPIPTQTPTARSAAPRRAPPPASVRAPVVVPAAPLATAAKDCDPPYTIDAAGEKHYKKECL